MRRRSRKMISRGLIAPGGAAGAHLERDAVRLSEDWRPVKRVGLTP